MSLVISPNMSLPIPGVGTQPGPTYATNIDACLTLIDKHDHSLGNGVQITPAGLNINANLSFNNSAAINLNSLTLLQTSTTTIQTIYVAVDGTIHYIDVAGNDTQITKVGGGINASSSGISSGTATASFSGSPAVLVVNSAAGVPASIQAANIQMGPTTSAYLTLSPPTLSGNITLTLPQVSPSGTQFVAINTGGVMSPVTSNVVAAGATRSTGTAVGANGVAISSGNAHYVSTATTPFIVTGTVVGLVTSGRPIVIGLTASSPSSVSTMRTQGTAGTGPALVLQLVDTSVGTNVISQFSMGTSTNNQLITISPSSISTIYVAPAGSYSFALYAYVVNAGAAMDLFNIALYAYEL